MNYQNHVARRAAIARANEIAEHDPVAADRYLADFAARQRTEAEQVNDFEDAAEPSAAIADDDDPSVLDQPQPREHPEHDGVEDNHLVEPQPTEAPTPARLEALDPYFAPGCFGSALTYENGSKECSPCPFAAQCAPRAAESWANLRKFHGLDGAKANPDVPAWYVEACRRAGDLVPYERARKTRDKQVSRSRLETTPPEPAKPAVLGLTKSAIKEGLEHRRVSLRAWLDVDGHSQRKLRPRFAEILKCWAIFQHTRLSLGRDPTPLEFGRGLVRRLPGLAFTNEASAGQSRIKMLRRLEEPGGPWAP